MYMDYRVGTRGHNGEHSGALESSIKVVTMLFSSAPQTYNHCKNHELSCKVLSFPQIPSSRFRISPLPPLVSPNGTSSMRLGDDFTGLHGSVQRCKSSKRAGSTTRN
ncbi:hypothetical protein OIU78_005870 [Salix suchowensis]|nr:hypothetical protein OIU78_005870 [Salix suchowensis]